MDVRLLTFLWILLSSHQSIQPAQSRCPAATDPHLDADNFYWHNSANSAEDATDKQWFEHGGFCYRYVASPRPWYPAELVCRFWGAHLVSIRSKEENRLVGRLSECRGVWIGRFATDFHRMSEQDSYEWTEDETASGVHDDATRALWSNSYYGRNASSGMVADRHAGAVRAESLNWINTHYHERLPFVCKTASTLGGSGRCPAPMSQFSDHCYWLSDFVTSFVDASLHCERELGGHLASVHSPAEARFIASLELDTDSCLLSNVWVGLIRQSPCRRAGSPMEENEHCYQWTDFSGEHLGYPHWANGHPLGADDVISSGNVNAGLADKLDWRINCATLSGEGLRSERCHSRRRFVCKVEQGKSHRMLPEQKEAAAAAAAATAASATVEEPGLGNGAVSK